MILSGNSTSDRFDHNRDRKLIDIIIHSHLVYLALLNLLKLHYQFVRTVMLMLICEQLMRLTMAS